MITYSANEYIENPSVNNEIETITRRTDEGSKE